MLLLLVRRKLSSLLLPCSSSCSTAAHRTTLISSSSHHLLFRSILGFSTAPTQNPSPETPFIVEYLINSCGFSSEEAIEASKPLTHIKSPFKPDSVIHFLKQSGLSDTQIRNLVSKCPKMLSASVERTLKPKVRALQEMGFSEPELVQLVSGNPDALRARDLQPKIEFWRNLFETHEDLLKAINRNHYLLSCSLGKRIMPNISLIRECGIPDRWIAKMILKTSRFITGNPASVKATVERADKLGVSRGSAMFRHALQTVVNISRTTLDAKFKLLKSLGWSEAESISAIKKAPALLRASQKKICSIMEFLIREAGCEPSYVACHPVLLMLSLERRLIPRHYVLRTLKREKLLGRGSSLSYEFKLTEKEFIRKFILPYKEKVPGLHEAYVAACNGKVPHPMQGFEEE